MTWFKIDDKFHGHPKVLAAGNAAVGLWVRCGAWTSDQLTEGRIPRAVAEMYGTKKEIAALLEARLWVQDGENYLMPDFLDFNPTKAEAEETARKRREAGSAGGKKSGESRRSKSEANHEANASPFASQLLEANTNPVPSRPVPSPTHSSSSENSSLKDQATDDDGLVDRLISKVAHQRAAARARTNPIGYATTVIERMNAEERSAIARFLIERPEARDDLDTAATVYEAVKEVAS